MIPAGGAIAPKYSGLIWLVKRWFLTGMSQPSGSVRVGLHQRCIAGRIPDSPNGGMGRPAAALLEGFYLDFLTMSDDFPGDERESGLAVQQSRPKLRRPPLYKVLLLNDDYTPMEFVVDVLETFFGMNREKATQIMLHVHTRGVGVCGVYTRDIAETRVAQVNDYSRSHQHPLMCTMEEA